MTFSDKIKRSREVRQLTQQPTFIQAGNSLLNTPVAARWQRKILDVLAIYHQQHQDEPGPEPDARFSGGKRP